MINFKLVMELIGISVLINENTEYCSFVDFSGHVGKVKIRVFKSKELCIDRSDRIYVTDLYCNVPEWKSEDQIISELEDAKKILSGYLYKLDDLEQIESIPKREV